MILRALALLVGVPLFLIGLLATVIAVGMVGDPGPQGAQLAIAAQVITVVLMVGVTITGAALSWLGVRKRSQRLAADTSPSGSQTAAREFDTVVRPRETVGGSTTPAYALPSVVAATSSSCVAIARTVDHPARIVWLCPGPRRFQRTISRRTRRLVPG